MDSATPVLLMLGGANPNVALTCIEQAHSRGLRVWLTDTSENLEHAPEIVAAADQVSILSYRDLGACVAWSLAQARTTPFIGVYGSREFAVAAVAAVSQALALPGNTLQAVERARNKLACRETLRSRGFQQPASALCANLDEACSFITASSAGPWIIKPLDASGSIGVSLVRNVSELKEAVAYLKRSCETLEQKFKQQGAQERSIAEREHIPFLIECFQPGQEYSAEGLFVYGQPHVLAITSKVTLGEPHFIETAHAMPALLPPDTYQKAGAVVEAALLALDLKWGQFHVEFWLHEGQVILGEVHARLGGDQLHFMLQHITGVEYYGLLFDQLLGRAVDITRYQPYRGAAIRFFTPARGSVTAIHGWDSAIVDKNCLLAQLKLSVGDSIGQICSSLDRPGFIITSGKTTLEAIQHAEDLVARVQIDIQEEAVDLQPALS